MRGGAVVGLAIVALLLAGCAGERGETAGSPSRVTSPIASPSPSLTLPCGAEIAESVTLSADLVCDGVGLIVSGDDVTLDLGRHTIGGPGPGRRSWPLPDFDIAGVVVRGTNVTVRNGTVRDTGIAVLVERARGATVTDIEALGNYYGVYLYQGSDHTVDGNSVRDNVYGLHLQSSTGNTVTNNDLSAQTHHSPGGDGLYLYASGDNHVEGNTVRDNLNWGLWFSDSTSNTIVRNNIIGNDPQVSDDTGGNVYFDEETREGNYWDDYRGEDANEDGIGDIPYSVGGPGRSLDLYPFTRESGWENRSSATLNVATPPPAERLPPRAWVVLADGRIAAIDTDRRELLDIWDGPITGDSVASSPDGARLYAISVAGPAARVLAYDTDSGDVVERWEIPDARVVAATYDGERVMVSTEAGLFEIVLDTGEVRDQRDGANAVAITPSWKHNLVLVTGHDGAISVVYLPDQHAPFSAQLPGLAVQVVDNRAGTRLFALVEDQSDVLILDTEQFLVTDRVPLGSISPSQARLAPSPDGSTLYLLDTASASLQAIDLATKQVVGELRIEGRPVDLAVSDDGQRVMVAVAGGGGESGRLLILDAELQAGESVQLPTAPVRVVAAR